MKNVLLPIFLLLVSFVSGQSNCNPNNPPDTYFYPNSTSTNTHVGVLYLCGPNTVVYDTTNPPICEYAYLNSGCTLYFRSPLCSGDHTFYLKNNSLLVNMSPASIMVISEPTATVSNIGNAFITTYTCSAISFPTVNCTSGITETKNQQNSFKAWPNPSINKLNIELISANDHFVDIKIINHFGEIVFDRQRWPTMEKEINIENLSNGTYFIQIKTKSGQQTEKLIVLR